MIILPSLKEGIKRKKLLLDMGFNSFCDKLVCALFLQQQASIKDEGKISLFFLQKKCADQPVRDKNESIQTAYKRLQTEIKIVSVPVISGSFAQWQAAGSLPLPYRSERHRVSPRIGEFCIYVASIYASLM